MQWLKHAFAVEPAGAAEPNEKQRLAVDCVCRQIVRRHLSTPALMFFEMSRPMNYLGSQLLHFFSPFLSALTDAEGHKHFASFLEQRGSIDYICRRIKELEEAAGE